MDASGSELLAACRSGDASAVARLLDEGADAGWADEEGLTPLMAAAEEGHTVILQALLEAGAPWNALDNNGHTAGEYAMGKRDAMQLLLDWGVRAELILGAVGQVGKSTSAADSGAAVAVNAEYLGQKLRYQDGKLMDENDEAVMMGWEAPLMQRHSDIICASNGDVLNVGFGLGIIDEFIQERQPRSHTIIEAHPDVYARMLELGWDKKPGVQILFGRWQDVMDQLPPNSLDGIFWDTYGEHYEDQRVFQQALPQLLRPGGVYSFFNGLCPDNIFFHLVYGEIVRRELNALGLSVKYDAVPIDASSDETWEGVANRYWHLPLYFVPTCVKEESEGAPREGEEGGEGAAAAEYDGGDVPAAGEEGGMRSV